MKRLADFDINATPTVNPTTLADLAAGGYLDAGEPVLLIGKRHRQVASVIGPRDRRLPNKAAGSATSPPPSSSTN